MLEVEVDKSAGFCFGVVEAIKSAEKVLENNTSLNCLGQIVHNEEEVRRLKEKGLNVISKDDFSSLKNKKVLIRAHGEPPETYQKAKENGIEVIDATCSIVLKLQNRISKEDTEKTQVVIFGKKNHPEVIGLNGQSNNRCIIVEKLEDLDNLDFHKDIHLYAQTTMDVGVYEQVKQEIARRIDKENHFKSHNTICGQMKRRNPSLKAFVKDKDVVIFVAGKNSSNGKYLFSITKNENPNSYLVGNKEEIDEAWFKGVKKVGVSGATSTPQWLMNDIANHIREIAL